MVWYVGRRLLQTVPVLLGATLLIHAMVFLLPGDPVAALFGNRPVQPAVAARIREEFNLDEPFLVQYLLYLEGVATLDLGTSFSGRPVVEVLRDAFPVTVRLALVALAVETVLGVGAGLLAGLRRGGLFDSTLLVVSLLLVAVPVFVVGLVAQFVVGVRLGLLRPTVGPGQPWGDLLLPGFVLGSVSFAYVLRLTRSSVAETLGADHVRTATAKGLSRPRVVCVHVLRNSLVPVVTFLGTDLGALMGGAVVTEGIFNVRGVGGTLYQAVVRQEGTTVVSFVTVLVLVYLLVSLAVDLLYALLDPRIRYA